MSADWFDWLERHPARLPPGEFERHSGPRLLAVLRPYRDMERWTADALGAWQRSLLQALAEHSAAQSPHFAARLRASGLAARDLGQPGGLEQLPPLTRQELVATGDGLFCRNTPPEHGAIGSTSTSGSTGEPVTVRRTATCRLNWLAHTLREHLWHRRDFSGRLAIVRANIARPSRSPSWGPPVADFLHTGPALFFPASRSLEEIAEALREFQPTYLLALPSLLQALLDAFENSGAAWGSLRGLRTLSETVSPALRDRARRLLGLEIDDSYTSQEGGVMATQCPEQREYHVSETISLEIVNDRGEACAPGESGRILITDLLNFATPLIRYEIGDYATRGAPCACGRALPTVARFAGRMRNLVLRPDGTRHWPLVGFHDWPAIFPIRQFQFRQLDLETVEAHFYAVGRPGPELEDALACSIRSALGHPFKIRFLWSTEPLPKGLGGKFEEFICLAGTSDQDRR